MTGDSGGSGFEWMLLALGVVLTLAVIGFFLFVLLGKDEREE